MAPKHAAVPPYPSESLREMLERYVVRSGADGAFSFGEYMHLTATQGVRGGALAKCAPFIKMILEVAPSGLVLFFRLKKHHEGSCSQIRWVVGPP